MLEIPTMLPWRRPINCVQYVSAFANPVECTRDESATSVSKQVYKMGDLVVRRSMLCRPQGAADDFRLLIQRPHATSVFSGDFDHGKSRADPLSSLQRTFAGSIVPLEVFAVNNSTLSPHQLCEYLQKFNPGEARCP